MKLLIITSDSDKSQKQFSFLKESSYIFEILFFDPIAVGSLPKGDNFDLIILDTHPNISEIILAIVATFSVVLNVAVFVYARSAISRLLYVSEELGDLKMMIDSFSNHVSGLYQMEMYYGDQTLQGLVDHAQSFNEQLETFEFIYSLTEEGITAEEIEEIDNEETARAEA